MKFNVFAALVGLTVATPGKPLSYFSSAEYLAKTAADK